MLDTESFKETVVFQAYNALLAARALQERDNMIEAYKGELQRLSDLADRNRSQMVAALAERDAANAKWAELAARAMLEDAAKPAGPQDETAEVVALPA